MILLSLSTFYSDLSQIETRESFVFFVAAAGTARQGRRMWNYKVSFAGANLTRMFEGGRTLFQCSRGS
jgi:hypothetical protein